MKKKVYQAPDFIGDKPDENRDGTCYYICEECSKPLKDNEGAVCDECVDSNYNYNDRRDYHEWGNDW